MKLVWLLFLVAAARATSEPNIYVINMQNMIDYLNDMLPKTVPVSNIDDKFAYNCSLEGLVGGMRLFENFIPWQFKEDLMIFIMSTEELHVTCIWNHKMMGFFWIGGTVTATFDSVQVDTILQLNLHAGPPALEEIRLADLPDASSIDFDKSSYSLEWTLKGRFNEGSAKDIIKRAIKKWIKEALDRLLKKLFKGGQFVIDTVFNPLEQRTFGTK